MIKLMPAFGFSIITLLPCALVQSADTTAQGQSKPRELASESIFGESRIPKRENGHFVLPPLVAPTTDISNIGNGKSPEDHAGQEMITVIGLPEGPDRQGAWTASHYRWRAANTYTYPLYFEDVMLERHGHRCKHCCQSVVSGARFFTTIAALPYLTTIDRPCECNYTLGHWRAGSCAPKLKQRPPLQGDAAINQALWTSGAILIFP